MKSKFHMAQWAVEAEIFLDKDEVIRTLISESLQQSLEDLVKKEFGGIAPEITSYETTQMWQREMAKVPQIMHSLKYMYGGSPMAPWPLELIIKENLAQLLHFIFLKAKAPSNGFN